MKKKTKDNKAVKPFRQPGNVAEYIHALNESDIFKGQVMGRRDTEARSGEFSPLDFLDLPLRNMLADRGISRLYKHQHAAISHILKGRNVVVSTATASGKSLIYNLPVLQELYRNGNSRALYLFPLKALARDQVRTFSSLYQGLSPLPVDAPDVPAAVYDGDTSAYKRKKIRESLPAVLVTNPDMLHLSLLPYHEKWGGFFSNLRFVVIDEVHTYRGVFGSHVAWIIRRLKRLCSLYGTQPIFILSSATVGNPEELARLLVDEPVVTVTKSSAASGRKSMMLINPVDSAAGAAVTLLEAAIKRKLRTIIYTQSRKMTELITMWTAKRLKGKADTIASYRAGFLPEDRREIETKLSAGTLLGVISTSALELGIDIGSLDICILVGYPGSVMATRQRAGRVGRSNRDALVVLLGHEDALDQYFMRHPDQLFNRPVEPITLDPDNPYIIDRQLVCAAAEEPLFHKESLLLNSAVSSRLSRLTESGSLLQSASGNSWFSHRKYPQRHVDIRGGGKSFRIFLSGKREMLGLIDGGRVFKECHSGAVYLHMAESYLVDRLDVENGEITVSPATPPFFTRATVNKETEILQTTAVKNLGSAVIGFGRLRVTEQVTGYLKINSRTMRTIGRKPLDFPPQIFETEGFWIIIDEDINRGCIAERLHYMGGIHAMEHALIGMLPLFVLCDRNDIGGISYPYHPGIEQSAVFVYDGYPGGIGLCRRGFEQMEKLLPATYEAVAACDCDLGCPGCVHSPKCGSGNRPIDKAASLFVISKLMQEASRPSSTLSVKKTTQVQVKENPLEIPKNYCVFDVETKRSAAEVGGWHLASRMGVSVAVLYDNRSNTFVEYEEEEVGQMIEDLFAYDLVIGFNNKRFDNKVLSAYSSRTLSALPTLDLLEAVYNRLGYRLSLDHLAETTLGQVKQGDGLQALAWYKNGELEKLKKYCRQDVELTRDLFVYGLRQRHLLFRNKAGKKVRLPVDFHQVIAQVLSGGNP